MRRFVMVTVSVVAVALVTGVAIAQMERAPMSPMAGGMGSGMMGPMMGAAGCPGLAGMGATPASLTEEKAKEAAQAYADKYLKGFTVEKALPFTGDARHDVLRRDDGAERGAPDLPRQPMG